MGQNIGTCATALLSSVGASKNAKGSSYIHLLFNVIGSVIFSIVAIIFFKVKPVVGVALILPYWISIVHSGFNIANTVFMFPFKRYCLNLLKLCVEHLRTRLMKIVKYFTLMTEFLIHQVLL